MKIAEYRLFSRILGIFLLDDKHTADYMAGALKNISCEWSRTNQITAVVTDHAFNIKKAVEP